MTKEILNENWQEISESLEMFQEVGLFPGIGYSSINCWQAWVFHDNPIEGEVGKYTKVSARTATEAMRNLLVEPEVVRLLEDTDRDPKDATAEELLAAAVWFYGKDMEPLEQQQISHFIHLGWHLARPKGWKYIHPWWLRESRKRTQSTKLEASKNDN